MEGERADALELVFDLGGRWGQVVTRETGLLERDIAVDLLDPALLVLGSRVAEENLEEILTRLDAQDGQNVPLGLDFELAQVGCLRVARWLLAAFRCRKLTLQLGKTVGEMHAHRLVALVILEGRALELVENALDRVVLIGSLVLAGTDLSHLSQLTRADVLRMRIPSMP